MSTGSDEPEHYVTERIREALAQDSRVNELELEVTMAGGKVFVSGTLPSQERKDAVTDVVREVVPDVEVHNQTSVMTPAGDVEDEELR
jgi:osmotically-inducible protein OsmY